ncbi:major facilitator superfamily domain-containing protein [Aspergillus stella-maris]|uniref:major facilitator superfamily domain-containing protein n=1 Tax=Aspergillus stella-maris TaxID=1810926 RepID=UPI003CCCDAA7
MASPEKLHVQNDLTVSQQIPYTTFSQNQKYYFTYLMGYLTLASSLTATIYFPLINLLSYQYNVSTQLINLTITVYVIFQAVSPAIWGPLSDTFGRRPVFLMTFSIYSAAALGLALNESNYAALAVLRGLQSMGGSAVMSLAYAVAADISPRSERGRILGPMLASTNLGPCVGPVVGGGAILASGNPLWCFWALLIFGGSSLLLIGWTLPETARVIVGNGAVPARNLWRTWWDILYKRRSYQISDEAVMEGDHNNINVGKSGKGKWTIPNPFSSVRIIFYQDTFLTLWTAAFPYAVWYCIQTSIPSIFGKDIYGYNDLIVGLCYLPGGFGVILGGLIAGRLMDWNYKHTALQHGLAPSTTTSTSAAAGTNACTNAEGEPSVFFPYEIARSRGSYTILTVSTFILIGYGWAVEHHAHPSIPLILQTLTGAKCTVILQMFSALLVDIFPERPGTAAAANNITRCVLSAAVIAALQPLSEAVGRAWLFTMLALVDGGVGLVVVWVLRRWGGAWRDRRERGG